MLLLLPFGGIVWVHWVRSLAHTTSHGQKHTPTNEQRQQTLFAAQRQARRWGRKLSADLAADAAATQSERERKDAVRAGSTALTSSECPASRRPYHVLLTATAQVYQQWQCRACRPRSSVLPAHCELTMRVRSTPGRPCLRV